MFYILYKIIVLLYEFYNFYFILLFTNFREIKKHILLILYDINTSYIFSYAFKIFRIFFPFINFKNV